MSEALRTQAIERWGTPLLEVCPNGPSESYGLLVFRDGPRVGLLEHGMGTAEGAAPMELEQDMAWIEAESLALHLLRRVDEAAEESRQLEQMVYAFAVSGLPQLYDLIHDLPLVPPEDLKVFLAHPEGYIRDTGLHLVGVAKARKPAPPSARER